MIDTKNYSGTLTAGAAVSTLVQASSPYTGLDNECLGLPVVAAIHATNTNALLSASVTLQLQTQRTLGGSGSPGAWTTEKTVVLDLGSAAALTGSKHAAISFFVDNPLVGGNCDSDIDVRLLGNCTGQNVTLDVDWMISEPATEH